ncbi:zinc finger CCHC domain-containing protein 9-like [Ptychodera flava]|uniref:zinc finger CCHC domain-containing protein 9-like n=1 Tax=Ptychodera flava TaxID=63121 RepID=UPI00396A2695
MTRWARGGPKKRPHEASSWGELQSSGEQCTKESNKTNQRVGRQGDDKQKPKKKKHKVQSGNTGTDQAMTATLTGRTDSAMTGKPDSTDERTSHKEKKRKKFRHGDLERGDGLEARKQKDEDSSSSALAVEKKKKELSAVELAAKKDKRREDRRLKRIKERSSKKVCFQCRKPGHGVADCPDLIMDIDQGMGICFRCGSTEHSSHQCRVKLKTKKGEFQFAKCFICHQMGHLSKQCPDNPRGLYPHGGGCKLCGSVEHFVRDCPEEPIVKAPEFGGVSMAMRRFESADAEPTLSRPFKKPQVKPKGPKVVNF